MSEPRDLYAIELHVEFLHEMCSHVKCSGTSCGCQISLAYPMCSVDVSPCLARNGHRQALQVGGFLACEDELCHLLSNTGRELEAVPTEAHRAVEPFVRRKAVENWAKVGYVVVDTSPATSQHGFKLSPGNIGFLLSA